MYIKELIDFKEDILCIGNKRHSITMKKLLITTAVAFSVLSFASAEDVSSTATSMPAALPPVAITGDQKIDEQVRALHKEMEAKIKALRDEYQKKLKAIIGERKVLMASSTKEVRKEGMQEVRNEIKEVRKDIREEVRGTSTKAMPQGNAWGFFQKFFGRPKATTTTQ